MTPKQEYHGWTNYPTYIVNRWLTNEEEMYRELKEMANSKTLSISQKIDRLKKSIQENNPLKEPSLYSTLLQNAIDRVDYPQIITAAQKD